MSRVEPLPIGHPLARPWARWRTTHVTAICTLCSWRRYTYTPDQAAKPALRHARETGHPVTLERVSTRTVDPRPTPAEEAPR